MTDNQKLVKMAEEALKQSYAPYSGFHVGAALLCSDGTVYTGCNVENASYGASNCAERTAVFKAVSEGKRDFLRLAVVSDGGGLTPPCGICRQVLAEFCGPDFEILMCEKDRIESVRLKDLLPFAFKLD